MMSGPEHRHSWYHASYRMPDGSHAFLWSVCLQCGDNQFYEGHPIAVLMHPEPEIDALLARWSNTSDTVLRPERGPHAVPRCYTFKAQDPNGRYRYRYGVRDDNHDYCIHPDYPYDHRVILSAVIRALATRYGWAWRWDTAYFIGLRGRLYAASVHVPGRSEMRGQWYSTLTAALLDAYVRALELDETLTRTATGIPQQRAGALTHSLTDPKSPGPIPSYFASCVGAPTYTPVKYDKDEALLAYNVRAALDTVRGTPVADVLVGFVHLDAIANAHSDRMCAALDERDTTITRLKAEIADLRDAGLTLYGILDRAATALSPLEKVRTHRLFTRDEGDAAWQ